MKKAFELYIRSNNLTEQVKDIYEEQIAKFMNEHYPRFYEMVEIFGSPIEMVSLKQEKHNIASNTAELTLISRVEATYDKQLKKKFLLSITVNSLKAVCAKLFKVEPIRSRLIY